MTDAYDDEDGNRPRTLTNGQVIRFMAGHWMAEPKRFALIAALMLASTACDLSIPWATRALIDAVATPTSPTDTAWIAWASLSALYLAFYCLRSFMFRMSNGYYSRIMARMVTQAFARVQAFSADWHA
ncbi:MAG: ABC transporter ATP-binding protein, partial [Phenylobacterium sp.]|nr:ABC transporter ATP-binding protein [Phenylobacterium sp.]